MSRLVIAALTVVAWSSPAFSQVSVKDAWVRATVPQQKSSGAFMQISSPSDVRLVEVKSTAAGIVEIHAMRMEGDVMKMNAVPGIAIPAGQTIDLKPGGFHVMLMDLKQQLKAGETVPITLVLEGSDKQRSTVQVNAPVRQLNASSASSMHKH